MPLYEYRCTDDDCDHEVEKLQKVGAKAPVCDKDEEHGPMERKVSQTRFKLMGGGWASSGYAG